MPVFIIRPVCDGISAVLARTRTEGEGDNHIPVLLYLLKTVKTNEGDCLLVLNPPRLEMSFVLKDLEQKHMSYTSGVYLSLVALDTHTHTHTHTHI